METVRQRINRSFPWLLLGLWLLGSVPLWSQPAAADSSNYFRATRYYEQKDYARALEYFRNALGAKETFVIRNPQVYFKTSYCFYRLGDYEDAIAGFLGDASRVERVEDYRHFFVLRARLALGDTLGAIISFREFRRIYPQSPLNITADSLLAELYFQQRNWSEAKVYYQRLLRYRGFDEGDIYSKLIIIADTLRENDDLKDFALTLMRQHPFHPGSKRAYDQITRLYQKSVIQRDKLNEIFRYLGKTSQFEAIDRLLARQTARVGSETEQVRWLKIRKLYLQNRYQETLQACREQRGRFSAGQYLREVDIHIARCYLRLGSAGKAIAAYDTFQKRYPRDGLAAEVLWVIAGLCEDRNEIEQARAYYQRLLDHYPYCEFISEARFRLGLTYYRELDYSTARNQWAASIIRERDDEKRDRYQYWIAKSYLQQDSTGAYLNTLNGITVEPFDNYYTMKAFLLTRNGVQIRQFVDSLLWEMHHKRISYLPQYLEYFQRPLLVQDLLGERYAQRELNMAAGSLDKPNWEMVFALGEVNERMQNYGRAYRLYRKVYLENFVKSDWREWMFLLKHLYPLYFNGEVNRYARQWNISPASIWAVMKKESAFEPEIMSYANAYGLMQIIPPTATRLSGSLGMELGDVRRLYEPNFNIQLGSFYLSQLLHRYGGNLYHALAAYNAGEHRVDRWRKIIDTSDDDFFMENIEFEQTRGYVRGVMKFYWMYHLLIHPYKMPEDLVSFPEKIAHDPWFKELEGLE